MAALPPQNLARHPTLKALTVNTNNDKGNKNKENVVSASELTKHGVERRWVAIAGRVYDLSEFYTGDKKHPGGTSVFKKHLGKDATTLFMQFHYPRGTAVTMAPGMCVGTLKVDDLKSLNEEDDEDDDDEGSLLDPL